MKGFLFDENLPRVPSLQTGWPITHALNLGSRLTDSQLWDHAQQRDLAIVPKDADFSQRIVLGVRLRPELSICESATCAVVISPCGLNVFGHRLCPRLPHTSP